MTYISMQIGQSRGIAISGGTLYSVTNIGPTLDNSAAATLTVWKPISYFYRVVSSTGTFSSR
jgi:hypothetical protein